MVGVEINMHKITWNANEHFYCLSIIRRYFYVNYLSFGGWQLCRLNIVLFLGKFCVLCFIVFIWKFEDSNDILLFLFDFLVYSRANYIFLTEYRNYTKEFTDVLFFFDHLQITSVYKTKIFKKIEWNSYKISYKSDFLAIVNSVGASMVFVVVFKEGEIIVFDRF